MSGRYRLADRIAHAMLAEQYGSNICFGDDLLNGCVIDHGCKGKMTRHPIDRMIVALNALERAPDLFAKRRIHGVDTSGRPRVVRSFKLIGTPRATPTTGQGGASS